MMPKRTRVTQSKISPSFWFVQEVCRVKTERRMCVMDDFGFLATVNRDRLKEVLSA